MVSPTNGAGSAGATRANTVPECQLWLLEGNGAGHLQQLPGAGTRKEEVGRLGRVKLRAAPHRRPRPERDRRAQSGRGPFQYTHPGKGSGRNGAEARTGALFAVREQANRDRAILAPSWLHEQAGDRKGWCWCGTTGAFMCCCSECKLEKPLWKNGVALSGCLLAVSLPGHPHGGARLPRALAPSPPSRPGPVSASAFILLRSGEVEGGRLALSWVCLRGF